MEKVTEDTFIIDKEIVFYDWLPEIGLTVSKKRSSKKAPQNPYIIKV